MPPRKCTTIAAGTVGRIARGPNSSIAVRMPSPGPGFDSIMKKIDLPASAACSMPSGVKTPWLIALLRNSTFAGSTTIDTSGSSPVLTSAFASQPRPWRDPERDRADDVEADDRHDAADDAGGEVVDEHLEAALDLAGDRVVPLLQEPRGQRAEDERAPGWSGRSPRWRPDGDLVAVERDPGQPGSATGAIIAPTSATAPTTPPRCAVDPASAGVADQDRDQDDDQRADDRS